MRHFGSFLKYTIYNWNYDFKSAKTNAKQKNI